MSVMDDSVKESSPLFRFDQERPYVVSEVSRRVYKDYLAGARRDASNAGLTQSAGIALGLVAALIWCLGGRSR